MYTFTFDGTFEGLLTLVFESYVLRRIPDEISSNTSVSYSLYQAPVNITTDLEKAARISKAIRKKVSENFYKGLYKIFLSDLPAAEILIYRIIKKILDQDASPENNFGDSDILQFHQISKQIDREVHRMHAFVRFKKNAGGVYVSYVEPDFNVLPLLEEHFMSRYADQRWIIFDLKRKYGIYFDLVKVSRIQLHIAPSSDPDNNVVSEPEMVYENLWQQYFQAVNIPERKNLKLHVQHVPKRYWKHLPEKHITKL